MTIKQLVTPKPHEVGQCIQKLHKLQVACQSTNASGEANYEITLKWKPNKA